MQKGVIKAAIFGAIVAFIWSMLSWVALPWHNMAMNTFKDEAAVAEVIKANVAGSGVYLLPSPPNLSNVASKDHAAATQAFKDKIIEGPLTFVAVDLKGGDPNMIAQIGMSFAKDLIAAFLIAMLLVCVNCSSYISRVGFVGAIGLITGLLSESTYYIWFHHGIQFSLVNLVDYFVTWTLAGIVMAMVLKPKAKTM